MFHTVNPRVIAYPIMTKAELIEFLEPFDDDAGIIIRRNKVPAGCPFYTSLEYSPPTDEAPAVIVINMHGIGAVETYVGA